MHQKVRYDSLKDFEFISTYATQGNVLVVNPSQPPGSVKEFIDWARARGSQLNMASAGVGSSSHFVGTHFMMAANLQSTHVPYKGGGPAAAAVVAGEAHWTLIPGAAAMSLVKGGRLRALGHTFPQRTRQLGDLPAIAETLAGFENVGQTGLMAPKGTPRPILDKLRNTLVKVMNTPEIEALFAEQGAASPARLKNSEKTPGGTSCAMANRRAAGRGRAISFIGGKTDYQSRKRSIVWAQS